jgi:phytoene synthase
LPQDELERFGIKEADLARGQVTPGWRQFMRFQIERTRKLYAEAWPGVKMLEREGRMAIGAASVFYQGILDDIEAHDYDVFNRRARLNVWQKMSRIPALWLKLRRL